MAENFDRRIETLSDWITSVSLPGCPQTELLQGYCEKLLELGVPILRVHVTQSAHHPVYGGMGFEWEMGKGSERQEYAHNDGNAPETWLQSPFFHLLSTQLDDYRERIIDSNEPSRFPLLNEMREKGATDYYAAGLYFEQIDRADVTPQSNTEGALLSWMSDGEDGFSDADLALIKATLPLLGLALKSEANRNTAEGLLGVYLGRDAGNRVLSGEIHRGSTQWIDAVICYFDLQGFTALSQRIPGEALIEMLNDYFGVVVSEIDGHGGNVLKYMGDGLLAIFDREEMQDAPIKALETIRALQRAFPNLNARRERDGVPTTSFTLALHAGRVLYGNIGGEERLDFTVIGPEVNLTARLSGMHTPLGQDIILSEEAIRDVPRDAFGIVSLGTYMMRGVDQPKELFTLYSPPDRER